MGRPNTLVYAEEVFWIVFRLDGCQTLLVITIGALHTRLAFFHHEVYVGFVGRIRMQSERPPKRPLKKRECPAYLSMYAGGWPVSPSRTLSRKKLQIGTYRRRVYTRAEGSA